MNVEGVSCFINIIYIRIYIIYTYTFFQKKKIKQVKTEHFKEFLLFLSKLKSSLGVTCRLKPVCFPLWINVYKGKIILTHSLLTSFIHKFFNI